MIDGEKAIQDAIDDLADYMDKYVGAVDAIYLVGLLDFTSASLKMRILQENDECQSLH